MSNTNCDGEKSCSFLGTRIFRSRQIVEKSHLTLMDQLSVMDQLMTWAVFVMLLSQVNQGFVDQPSLGHHECLIFC